jgi:nitrite reductase/ring-hydroxylating ferredoxin subunit
MNGRAATHTIDLERVVCRLSELGAGAARAFTIGSGDWPLRGFVLRVGESVCGYVNRCPHAGHPLDLLPGRFLSADGLLIVCGSHGALFEKSTGLCVGGPCVGRSLTPVPLEIRNGCVLIAEAVDISALGVAPP